MSDVVGNAAYAAKKAPQAGDVSGAVETERDGVGADDVVGHKTFSDGNGGFRHEPLTRAEGDALWAAAMAAKAERATAMPDERAALNVLWGGFQRLRELGWKEWIYMPKDGTLVDLIEAGSTGIHQGYYSGEWPKGTVWICDEGDAWPSHPILFRERPTQPPPESTAPASSPVPEVTGA